MESLGLSSLIVGGLILAIPFLDPKRNWARTAAFGLCIVLIVRYVGWRFFITLPPIAWRFDSLYPWGFSVVELLANIGWILGFVTLSRTVDRSQEATEQRHWLEALPQLPRVDALIATYNEDEAILRRTIVGALALDYPGLRVWVLDDGRRLWLKALCEAKGALYLTRPDNRHAKGGNINHALSHLRDDPDPPQFIAVFDADFVPHPEFLRRTMPLFHDDSVGLVQTPQHFFNKDPIQSNLLLGDVWPDEQRFFFDAVMPSKDAWGAAFCCGTSSVIRVRALEEAGGFPVDSVTEDFLVTLRLDQHGWRTVYLNERLSVGLAPEGIPEYVTQRGRWCLGLMQIVRSPLGPLARGPLTLAHRIALVDAFLYWAASFPFKLLCLLSPVVFWFTGVTVGAAPAGDVVDHFLPYYAAVMITLNWAANGLIQPVMTDVCHVLTLPVVLRSMVAGLFGGRNQPFKVTDKGIYRDRVTVYWPMVARFGGLIALTVGGMLYASLSDYAPQPLQPDLNAMVLFWSAYNILVLLLAISACVQLPRYRREERFRAFEPVEVRIGDQVFASALYDISVRGARVRTTIPARHGDIVWLTIEDVGEIAGRVVALSDSAFAAEFVDIDRVRDSLIRKVFSGRYYERGRGTRGHRLVSALLARSLR